MRRSGAPSQQLVKRARFISPAVLSSRSNQTEGQSVTKAESRDPLVAANVTANETQSNATSCKKLDDVLQLIGTKRKNVETDVTDITKLHSETPNTEQAVLPVFQIDDGSSQSDLSQQADGQDKKRNTSSNEPSANSDVVLKKKTPTFKPFKVPSTGTRQPLSDKNMASEGTSATISKDVKTLYFNVMWCKASKKKHKKWEGDAVLITMGRSVTLIDMEGKEIGKATGYKTSELETLNEGQTLFIGGKEIEVMSVLTEDEYKTGRCFHSASIPAIDSVSATNSPRLPTGNVIKPFVKPNKDTHDTDGGVTQYSASTACKPVTPRFDPSAPGALVMPRPTKVHQFEYNKTQQPVIDVVVDPYLSQHLRPHQRDGVVFLYQCVLGMRGVPGQGAILADEMGLGKTLQCITLIWTLFKQGPYGGKPFFKNILIITPGSLVKNWCKEFRKWLGNERLKVFAVDKDKKPEEYIQSKLYPVLIISYEMFVRTIDVIKQVKFDLIVCDEGHRLKNSNIKTTTLVNSLNTRRRVLLTGTPVQNDLQELFSIVDLCNPGILGPQGAFKHVYETPILASRQPGASPDEVALGESRAAELARLISAFVLRRTQEINKQYLPPKADLVLFCRPSELQLELYRRLISSRAVYSCLSSSDSAKHLMCIAALKKLCNHPSLIYKHPNTLQTDDEDLYMSTVDHFPADFNPESPCVEHSGKLSVLHCLLSSFKHAKERVVLVSNYTQTLDVLEKLCTSCGYSCLRLDGQTPTNKRQQLVERFNNAYSQDFVFLLSSKAGGVGLNLIGASRLVLYDLDWNPANDLQAMARVWRDGQKRKVFVYRLITTGTLEEKIFQRQISKQGLSGAVVDAKTNLKLSFSREELKDLFRLDSDTLCNTHDLLRCNCNEAVSSTEHADVQDIAVRYCQIGASFHNQNKNVCMSELMEWNHVAGPNPDLQIVDSVIDTQHGFISFAFWCESNMAKLSIRE